MPGGGGSADEKREREGSYHKDWNGERGDGAVNRHRDQAQSRIETVTNKTRKRGVFKSNGRKNTRESREKTLSLEKKANGGRLGNMQS